MGWATGRILLRDMRQVDREHLKRKARGSLPAPLIDGSLSYFWAAKRTPESAARKSCSPVLRAGLLKILFGYRNRARVPGFAANDQWHYRWGADEAGVGWADAKRAPGSGSPSGETFAS